MIRLASVKCLGARDKVFGIPSDIMSLRLGCKTVNKLRPHPYKEAVGLTFREIAGRDFLRIIGQVPQCSIQLTLSDHEM
jgi:hypothetical protein